MVVAFVLHDGIDFSSFSFINLCESSAVPTVISLVCLNVCLCASEPEPAVHLVGDAVINIPMSSLLLILRSSAAVGPVAPDTAHILESL